MSLLKIVDNLKSTLQNNYKHESDDFKAGFLIALQFLVVALTKTFKSGSRQYLDEKLYWTERYNKNLIDENKRLEVLLKYYKNEASKYAKYKRIVSNLYNLKVKLGAAYLKNGDAKYWRDMFLVEKNRKDCYKQECLFILKNLQKKRENLNKYITKRAKELNEFTQKAS